MIVVVWRSVLIHAVTLLRVSWLPGLSVLEGSAVLAHVPTRRMARNVGPRWVNVVLPSTARETLPTVLLMCTYVSALRVTRVKGIVTMECVPLIRTNVWLHLVSDVNLSTIDRANLPCYQVLELG